MANRTTVMISSTARDLPEHRAEVLGACARLGMFPLMMEHLPASDADAIQASLAMVDEADVYVGIFAHRYGYVPRGHETSITEMEYDRAVARGIPRLIFVMHDDHEVRARDVDRGDAAVKLDALRARVTQERVVSFFKSPADLRAHVIASLAQLGEKTSAEVHAFNPVPARPVPYIAHHYSLLQTRTLIGRQAELNLLTDWVTRSESELYKAPIFNVVGIGGMGKSALTWKWFNEVAPRELPDLAGRMWWSFYENDATFENFAVHALSYTSGASLEETRKIPPGEREEHLLRLLDREPFLLVLDGMERLLVAYARMDAARLADDDLDEKTMNEVIGALGLPQSSRHSFLSQHHLRRTADPRLAAFLRRLAAVSRSRILISTRLYPADLQTSAGGPVPGSAALFLPGMSEDDALNLWRAFGASGRRDVLVPLFERVESHPLLIQVLASVIAHYREAPGDFDRWRQSHPDFNPFTLPLVQVKSHVLLFALRGLGRTALRVLRTIAGFRMPASYETLAALLVGIGRPVPTPETLDTILTDLEDRGLLGWDRQSNRYDLHPIVRGVTWSGMATSTQRNILQSLHTHFESLPTPDVERVRSFDELAADIELYNALVGLGRYDEAFDVFYERIFDVAEMRLGDSHRTAEVVDLLFSNQDNSTPPLAVRSDRAAVALVRWVSYHFGGRPGEAERLFDRAIANLDLEEDRELLVYGMRATFSPFPVSGNLRKQERGARALVRWNTENNGEDEASCRCGLASAWQTLGLVLAACGKEAEARAAIDEVEQIVSSQPFHHHQQSEAGTLGARAQSLLWLGDVDAAVAAAERGWECCLRNAARSRERVRVARIRGEARFRRGDSGAMALIEDVLRLARTARFLEEELACLVCLAAARLEQGDADGARRALEEVWEPAERGPYTLILADALNLLARVHQAAGATAPAIEAATRAFRAAWCDGPPFAYARGLAEAREHLRCLGAQEPEVAASSTGPLVPESAMVDMFRQGM